MLRAKDKAPQIPRESRQRVCKGKRTCGTRHKAERGVCEKILVALQNGVKGDVWFSLVGKVFAERTPGLVCGKVKSNAGACGIDGMSVGHFGKDSERRLLAVNKRLKEGAYELRPVKRVMIPKAGGAELRPLGIASLRSPLRGYSFVVRCLAALGSDGGGPRGADHRRLPEG